MNGGIYTSGVPENKMNSINFNFFIDTVPHSRSNVIIYIDSDHDHCLVNGNVIVNKKNNSGKISIEYKNLEQFESVSEKLKRS